MKLTEWELEGMWQTLTDIEDGDIEPIQIYRMNVSWWKAVVRLAQKAVEHNLQ